MSGGGCEARNITSTSEYDSIFWGLQCIFNWVQDVETELELAAREDARFWGKRIRFCQEFLATFPNEDDPLIVGNMRRAIAESRFMTGERNEADRLFSNWLAETPRWGWGWIAWSDLYSWPCYDAVNHDKAESILRRGWSVQGVEEKEVMRKRFCDLYRKTGREEEAQALEAETKDKGRRK